MSCSVYRGINPAPTPPLLVGCCAPGGFVSTDALWSYPVSRACFDGRYTRLVPMPCDCLSALHAARCRGSRVLTGLVHAGFDDIARVGSHRRAHKSLLEYVVHSCPGRDAKQVLSNRLRIVRWPRLQQRGVVSAPVARVHCPIAVRTLCAAHAFA